MARGAPPPAGSRTRQSINVAPIHNGIVTARPFPNRRLAVGSAIRAPRPQKNRARVIVAHSDRRQAVGLGNGRRHGSTIVVPTVEVVRGAARRLAIRRSRMANTTSRPTRCRIIEGPTLTQTDDLSSVPRSAQRRPQNNRARVIAANSDRRQAVGLGSGRHHGSTIVVPTVEVVPVLKSCGVRRAAGLDNVTQRPSRRLCFLVPKLRLGTQIPEALLRSSSAVARRPKRSFGVCGPKLELETEMNSHLVYTHVEIRSCAVLIPCSQALLGNTLPRSSASIPSPMKSGRSGASGCAVPSWSLGPR